MSEPRFANEAERTVWSRLVHDKPDDWIVLPNIRLTDEGKDHEVDLLVLAPGLGAVALEVKGGSVWVEGEEWRQGSPHRSHKIRPVEQALGGTYALREYVETDPRWGGRRRILWSWAVALPHSSISPDFALPSCPRWAIHGRDDMARLAERLAASLRSQREQRAPTLDDCQLVAEILQGRNLPVRDVIATALEHEDRADRLTTEQATLLKVTRLLTRVEVRGGAGSGKTILAQTQARELSSGSHDRPQQRVALLCYSLGLAMGMERVAQTWTRRKQPAFVGSFEDFARFLGVTEFADREDSAFWEVELPRRMADLAADLPAEKKFDAVVVDEAQDFADDWWQPLLGALRDPETGGLYAFSDENQRVFGRFGRPSVAMVPLMLDRNLRNTKQIAATFRTLAPTGMLLSDYDGPEVTLVECATDDALDVADDQVDTLIDEGWRERDIVLLTTGQRHPEHVTQFERDQVRYWSSFWDDDTVFYGHVLGFKGLERRCVVLAVNDSPDRDRARERLYVGLSRATERLVVVGDPDVIRQTGGDSVLRQLQS
ncbi:NERD domain-containing protein [Barrientosiimonas humi]|uniref:nuclease-related domain-containing DEAD/DEAH box helicase n=1 Tax=Barrientosiimonas humi TaxID=999931 RepID=UPI00370D134A